MEKIRVCMPGKGQRIMNPLTKTQRTIMEKVGLMEEDLNDYITKDWPSIV
jgi:hypothetical protein